MLESGRITAPGQGDGGVTESGARRRGLLGKLAVVVPVALIFIYAVACGRAIPDSKWIDGLVLRTDFISTLTGALVIQEGNAHRLYDLQVQRAAQNQVLYPYFKL